MKRSLQCFMLLACLMASLCYAQEKNFDISTPIDMNREGLNKVLCMKNGNTLLFHFELGKPITVTVFDSTHKRIANTEPEYSILDGGTMRTFVFKGLYDIGGEAVLFIEQPNSGRHSLVRWRINATTGRMIEEKTLAKSKSMAKQARFYVMKNKREDNYALLVSSDAQQFKTCEMSITYYNTRHEAYKEVPLTFDRKKYDFMEVVGAESLDDGICVSLGLSKLVVNGTGTPLRTVSVGRARQIDALSEGVGSSLENASVYDHHLGIFFIAKDSIKPVSQFVDVTQDVFPFYANSSYNPFSKTINLLLLSYRDALYRYGLEMRPTTLTANLLFKLDEDNLATNYTWMTNKLANETKVNKGDTNNLFKGLPIKLSTNVNGLSTMVSESFSRYHNTESRLRPDVFETFLGDICVTQFDEEGNEIWGTVLPKSQYYKSYRHYYNSWELAKKWQQQDMFGDLPPQVYGRQFISCNTYNIGNDIYIVYNDGDNSAPKPGAPVDTVYSFDQSNTCYYKITKNKEVSKQYMFDKPLAKEYKAGFIEGADFDEKRGVYASLIQYKRGEYVSLRMAWRHLD